MGRTFSIARRRKGFQEEVVRQSSRGLRQAELLRERQGGDAMSLLDYALSYFPGYLPKLLQHWGVTVSVGEREWMNGIHSEMVRAGRLPKGGRLSGLFDPEAMTVDILDGIKADPSYAPKWQTSVDVAGHEICHFVDWITGTPSLNDEEFLECYKAEDDILPLYEASSSPEFFATAGWVCLRYPEQAREYIPKTFKWFSYYWAEDDDLEPSRYKASGSWRARRRRSNTLVLAGA